MKRRSLVISLSFALAVLLLLFWLLPGFFNPVSDLLHFALKPLQRTSFAWTGSVKKYLEKRESYDQLKAEIDSLSQERDSYLQEYGELKVLFDDLKMTREEEAFLKKNNFKKVFARIIGRTSDAVSRELIIDVGSQNGVSDGYAVVSQGGYVIGKIIEARNYNSTIRLITDQRSELAVQVLNEAQTQGLLVGDYNLSLKLELLPQNEVIQTDQPVATSGLETNIPKGLMLGVINSVSLDPGNIFQRAVVHSPIRFDKLGIVAVIIPDHPV